MHEHVEDDLEREAQVRIRGLKPHDFDAVVAVDAKNVGRRREEYFRVKLEENLHATGIRVSLAAETGGLFVGFLLARVFYGEFGRPEPAAVLEALAVHPDFQGHGVGRALLAQLRTNLVGLGVGALQTEVSWQDQQLMAFFHHEGFQPAARFALDLALTPGSGGV